MSTGAGDAYFDPPRRRGPGILGGEVEQTALLGPHHREEQHGAMARKARILMAPRYARLNG